MEKMDQKIAHLDKRIREMPYEIESSAKYVKSRLKEMTPDEQPFNQVNNKWYYVVCRGNENDVWEIAKFKNDFIDNKLKVIKKIKNGELSILYNMDYGRHLQVGYNILKKWISNINNKYFKAVYRWNGGEEWSPILAYDDEGGMIKFWVWKDFKTWEKAQRGIVTTAAIGLRAFGYWLIW
ncbi:hypothetical protein GL982_01985 [Spiroplasma citri]|uniref:Uncharacterized protein n=3 Tax=Spiroplasma citri TaxID=2133 RepID=A0AAJ4EIJ2_SPICI|nr:hypothetical protein [Spiroplasma citri]QIA68405.1 hypothetical protein GL298_01965 [Spiroplasma citri]QIA70279.1 hypothetical protein GL981_01970 [Spiroplasma citri]QIA72513.1 hypothetical protein GL982_01985 [Spiroplasma citri]QIA74553.1 hypothetical protein GTU57_01820 [Spiroplasma citri]QJU61289.1 hypothetical protein HHA36_01875 [Spiroplasma citri]